MTVIDPTDPFAEPAGPTRDRYGRPLITPRGGGQAIPYTRVSTFASALDDGHGLAVWQKRMAALGLGRHEDLAAIAAAVDYGDKKLDEVIETAIDRAGGSVKANYGTAIHAFTDPDPSPHVPERMRSDVEAYRDTMARHGITTVLSERFVVCDALKVAGTFDGVYDVPGYGFMIGDKKTGKIHGLSVAIQETCYANGELYTEHPDNGAVRESLKVRTDIGLLAHIPAGEGRCDLYTVDLQVGYQAALCALDVRGFRSNKAILKPFEPIAASPAESDVETPKSVVVELPTPAALRAALQAASAASTEERQSA